MAEPKDKSIKLRRRENFLSWLVLYEGIASVEDWFEINERGLEETESNDWFQDRTLKIIETNDGATVQDLTPFVRIPTGNWMSLASNITVESRMRLNSKMSYL